MSSTHHVGFAGRKAVGWWSTGVQTPGATSLRGVGAPKGRAGRRCPPPGKPAAPLGVPLASGLGPWKLFPFSFSGSVGAWAAGGAKAPRGGRVPVALPARPARPPPGRRVRRAEHRPPAGPRAGQSRRSLPARGRAFQPRERPRAGRQTPRPADCRSRLRPGRGFTCPLLGRVEPCLARVLRRGPRGPRGPGNGVGRARRPPGLRAAGPAPPRVRAQPGPGRRERGGAAGGWRAGLRRRAGPAVSGAPSA